MSQQMYAALAKIMESEGFLPAIDFVFQDGNMYVTNRITSHFKTLGIPGIDELGDGMESLADIAIARPFLHPLSETFPGSGENVLNGWACASMLINAAAMWGIGEELPHDGGKAARKNLKQWVAAENPTLNVDHLLDRARWDDNALLQLAAAAAGGFEKIAAAQLNC
jgi:hypothetical protein